jgi:hypothetical protein
VTGHVFIYRGDIRTLASDAWYLPADTNLHINPAWLAGDDLLKEAADHLRRDELPHDWGTDGTRVIPLRLRDPKRSIPVLAAIPVRGTDDPEYHRETLRQFVEFALTLPRQGITRSRPLLAVPVIGTGLSGGRWQRGRHLQTLLTALAEEAEQNEVDIALITYDGPTTAAAHAVRRTLPQASLGWAELDEDLREHAHRLSELARQGKLVIFSGAGIGRSAGLPDWKGLLLALAHDAGLDETSRARFEELDVLDQAALLANRMGDDVLRNKIASLLEAPHHGLSHGLLANLPVTEIATLNFDELHELAAAGAGYDLSILPYEPVTGRWRLKMHGAIKAGQRNDIVLTRSQYLAFSEHRASLTGLVQALLVTRHMLFIGFAFRDDHFHSVIYDVRRAVGDEPRDEKLGTALFLESDDLQRELWDKDLSYVAMDGGGLEAARRLEMFLDLTLSLASVSDEYLFDPTYDEVLTHDERELRDALAKLETDEAKFSAAPAWRRVRELLNQLGASRTS